ncbi:unnamed protein product [Schistocephalus solidus]|uniref:Uncharacterized protein n=1 Tax=Schistocephalus solidus TaxID=70667 RepID=A0A183T3N3_SCHSO|nr:unnamed protein product [Schistocephalus solidus]
MKRTYSSGCHCHAQSAPTWPGPASEGEEDIRQQETVFRAVSQKEEAVIVTAADIVATQHSSPGSIVCDDVGVDLTNDNQFIRLRKCRHGCVQILVEFFFAFGGGGIGRRR